MKGLSRNNLVFPSVTGGTQGHSGPPRYTFVPYVKIPEQKGGGMAGEVQGEAGQFPSLPIPKSCFIMHHDPYYCTFLTPPQKPPSGRSDGV